MVILILCGNIPHIGYELNIYVKYLILLLFSPIIAFSQENLLSKDLEKLFWMCDYISTRQAMDFNEAVACSSVFEKLIKEKFNGSFDAFMVWWKKNKDTEHFMLNKKTT